jgi:prolyl oligopeptidase
MSNRIVRFATSCVFALAVSSAVLAQQFEYPKARKIDHVDSYSGVAVPDPYRWLEDDNAADTAAWVEAENKLTFGYLNKIPFRKSLTERVIALNNYEKVSAPSRKGPYVFFRKNDGLQNQSVLYVQKGMREHRRS